MTIHIETAYAAVTETETTTLRLGDGWVTVDAATGAPFQFTDAHAPERMR